MNRRDFLIGASALATAPAGAAWAQAPRPPTAMASEARLAAYAAALSYDMLPAEIVAALRRLFIDTLACAFGAVGAPPAKIAEETFRAQYGGPQTATLIGGRAPISTEGATLVNGVLVRYLDLNDIYAGGDASHPSECIPAALACAEETGRSGRDLLTAIAIGYETQLALVEAVNFGRRGYHSVSCAGFVTPLIAGKLWGFTVAQMAHGAGISGPKQLTSLGINRGPISMVKALTYPHGAMDGVFAARMAQRGFTGAAGVLEYFVQTSAGGKKEFDLDLRTDNFRLLNVGLKRFPLQFELQSVAEAGVEIRRALAGRIERIRAIAVEASSLVKERTADPSRYAPTTKETADHSLPVCLALALTDGDVTVEQFEHDRWKDVGILALAQKVRVDAVGEPGGRSTGALVRATLDDGTSVEKRIDIPDGDPRRPLSEAALTGKFMQFAEPVLGKARAQALLESCHRIETFADVRQFTAMMRVG